MAFHCGAPTRDGSACQRHVREPGTRCSQHRNLGGPALRLPRFAMRTITLADPALTEIPTVWATAGTPRDRVTRHSEEESEAAATGRLDSEKREPEQVERSRQVGPEDESADPGADHGRAAQNGAAPKGGDVARAQPVERPPLLRK